MPKMKVSREAVCDALDALKCPGIDSVARFEANRILFAHFRSSVPIKDSPGHAEAVRAFERRSKLQAQAARQDLKRSLRSGREQRQCK